MHNIATLDGVGKVVAIEGDLAYNDIILLW